MKKFPILPLSFSILKFGLPLKQQGVANRDSSLKLIEAPAKRQTFLSADFAGYADLICAIRGEKS
ncbi:MAG: hypothetical protein GY862_12070 [Gammaproteobacteria bacterium]|nr:hypothetical protein [Gammaproteobacteria bacterium]